MGTYYTLLGVAPEASQEAIAEAYAHQRERYNPERVAELDPDLRKVAVERSTELEHAYAVLADAERRREYDASLSGTAGRGATVERRSLTPRERTYAIIGVVAALALIAVTWVLTGRGTAPQSQAMAEVNRPAPPFAVPNLAGGTVNLADYKGKVVLLNFWGTWCEPCKRELPALQAAHTTLAGEGLVVIGVNLTDDELVQGRDQAAIKAYLAEFGVTYPVALDVQGEVTNAYGIYPLPASFFIDGEGRIRYKHIGELTLADVQARFAELKGAAATVQNP
ncbi:MAG: redoxin domain-containing protein [Chloroflexales bacterium]